MKFSIVGASVQGYSHIHNHNNCPNQDAIFGKTYTVDNNGKQSKVTVIALADGVGSEALAEYGAQTAVKAATNFVGKNFYSIIAEGNTAQNAKLSVIKNVRKEVQFVAKRVGADISSLASTLLLAASDGESFFTFSCGDSVICHHSSNDGYKVTSPTYVDSDYSNATIVICGADSFLNQVHVTRGKLVNAKRTIDAFFLMSDGAAPLFATVRNKPDEGQDVVHAPDNFGEICDHIGTWTEREISEDIESQFEELRSERIRDDLSLIAMVNVDYNKK